MVVKILVNDQVVWTSPTAGVYDSDWSKQIIDISNYADGNSQVVVTFGLTTNSAGAEGGWNIDDVIVQYQLISGLTQPDDPSVPENYYLFQNYLNPCNPTTFVIYQLSRPGTVAIKIFNVLDKEVRTLLHGEQPAGQNIVMWDGKDTLGNDLASGIYLLQLEVTFKGEGSIYKHVRKMMLVQ